VLLHVYRCGADSVQVFWSVDRSDLCRRVRPGGAAKVRAPRADVFAVPKDSSRR
jgi:hypothetical protein